MTKPKVMGIDPLTGLPAIQRDETAHALGSARALSVSLDFLLRSVSAKEERERLLREVWDHRRRLFEALERAKNAIDTEFAFQFTALLDELRPHVKESGE